MVNITTQTIKSSGFGMPIRGHQCALGTPAAEAAAVRDRARTDVVTGLTTGAFPGFHAWSPPI